MSKLEIDHEYTDSVICPYCGYDNGGDDGDGPPEGEQNCRNEDCEKVFDCEPGFDVYYTTRKVPCRNGEPHDFRLDSFVYQHQDQPFQIQNCRGCGKHERVPAVAKTEEAE